MRIKNLLSVVKIKTPLALFTALMSFGITHSVMAAPAQAPLFLTAPVRPLMMLNMSNDHQLFFKAYDDYSDLDGDGFADRTYKNTYNYYGYFDGQKCYTYNTTDRRFDPSSFGVVSGNDGRYCNNGSTTNEWSGNFLNWATMTRMDAVRKILYGGLRSTDTSAMTILERAYLPQDAHAFAKYYNGSDIEKLTPFDTSSARGSITKGANTRASGITICNTTEPTNRSNFSQSDNGAPRMRVARGNFSLWASNERWQCRWGEGTNDNQPTLSGINAYSYSPTTDDNRLGGRDFYVRVRTCASEALINDTNNENCRLYGENYKPTGLLQEFGEKDDIYFGLLTGSYGANKSGGVLRKNIGSMTNEIDLDDGTFSLPTQSIIGTLNRLKIYGYRFDDGTYHSKTNSDNCIWAKSSFVDGDCSNWGNPQSEIYLESLRYLSGATATAAFSTNDSSRISGLSSATWTKPINNTNYCAPLSVIQFNASTSSYDWDQLGGASDINVNNLDALTNAVGVGENIDGSVRFVGQISGATGENANQLCTAKTVNDLANARGTCPDAPRLEGSYQIAGLAYHARKNGIPLSGVTAANSQTVRTYGVALAPAVPRITIPVPGKANQVTILPACRNRQPNPDANCAIVDFKIVSETEVTTNGVLTRAGKLYVNWEDSEQGGDFDQDMWGIIDYEVTSTSVKVKTDVIAQSSGDAMGFGYVISGTTSDGFHVHSGMNGFTLAGQAAPTGAVINGCNNCQTENAATTNTYIVGSSTTLPLEQPLYYAAKWGGYSDDFVEGIDLGENATLTDEMLSTEIAARDPKDTYFYATDPRRLEESLRTAFQSVAADVGSASAVATNSTRLSEGDYLYQARFNSEDWSGEILGYEFGENASVSGVAALNTEATMPTSDSGRSIYTNTATGSCSTASTCTWAILTAAQKLSLRIDGETDDVNAEKRFNWIRGDRTNEGGGGLRKRTRLLGDIVNSSPVYAGGRDMRYSRLPVGGNSYNTFLVTKRGYAARIFVGANDGMFHAFETDTLEPIFSYVPEGAYPKLANLTFPSYGRSDNPHQYIVDGPVTVGDVFIDVDGNGTGEWRTIAVGSLGAGGRNVFALDVTDPDDAPKVIFELKYSATRNQALGQYPELGYVMGKPLIVPMKNNRWAVVFGNGSEAGSSHLFVVDVEDPYSTRTKVISTGEGIGLSAPELMPNGLGQVEWGYAGDLSGNIWKFDLFGDDEDDWDVAYKLFQAVDEDGNAQPISAPPTLGRNALKDNAVMVYVGTGKYFDISDNQTNASPIHSFYAIADIGTAVNIDRSNLHQKTIAETNGVRTVTNNEPDWAVDSGWYLDFNVESGEKITIKALLLYDRLIFATLIPSDVPCNYGGTSWLMQVTAVGDKYTGNYLLDENIKNDYLILGDLGLGIIDDSGDDDDGSENEPDDGPCPDGTSPATIVSSGSDGSTSSRTVCLPGDALGRMTWRQLR